MLEYTVEPYLPNSTHPLHILHLWKQNVERDALWVLYIHGGAWRDPTQTLTMGHQICRHLVQLPQKHPHGLLNSATIEYRLSAGHALLPPNQGTVVHPGHLDDVRAAIAFLRRAHGMERYILVGHSAGATLALQTLLPSEGMGANDDVGCPIGIICLEGIYSLPHLYATYPDYLGFIQGAFGPPPSPIETSSRSNSSDSAHPWILASPYYFPASAFLQPPLSNILLLQTTGDELLDRSQTDLMETRLLGIEGKKVKVEVIHGEFGSHDGVVENHKVWEVVEGFVGEVQMTGWR